MRNKKPDIRTKNQIRRLTKVSWSLIPYDLLVFLFSAWFIFGFYKGYAYTDKTVVLHCVTAFLCCAVSRLLWGIYNLIWRYGGIQAYMRLLASDVTAFLLYYIIQHEFFPIPMPYTISFVGINLLICLAMRMTYRYFYKCGGRDDALGKVMRTSFWILTRRKLPVEDNDRKVRVGIIGAGSLGTYLADELISNRNASYLPVCFIDTDKNKYNREIHDIPVIPDDESTVKRLDSLNVQELVIAIENITGEGKKRIYEQYKSSGFKVKVYDYPVFDNAKKKRALREIDIEELLFRKPVNVVNEKTYSYYSGKVVLITGGGGSIGSELCRQIAKMRPGHLIILDICENGAYDVQQELKILYGNSLNVSIEIASICNRNRLEKVFSEYHPDIVINAAAHKHVPLMEKNCVEAVENNVFGTLNTVELAEKYACGRYMMVSTDKAVNPTNVMGATKRMCEMIVFSHAASSETTVFSCTRFGNVLGSAGSVIPLFRRQIANGGPVTLTDRRIIRYFMTIPEASQLVLESGSMAKNGELFVLDMGSPVKIYDLAENMIRLSGLEPDVDIKIEEIGLRPGEKLYEELLVKGDNLTKTDNDLIFIETDVPVSSDELDLKLEILRRAAISGDDAVAKEALRMVVPTFRSPEEVNAAAVNANSGQSAT
ncbi:MAG: polysaccharide biosynthesis protein [Clostridiales bacterium]|nr:polysaccharide biosynthesis protein [Clostridiales bacterium]